MPRGSSSTPFVSVVTPFYNTEDYLAEAIESVLAQTFTNFEYLLVDNRSTDDSPSIAARYAGKDRRIRVVTNATFLDQDGNFSAALQRISAESRYVKLVLADDGLLPRCLEEMVGVAEAHPSVGIVSSYYLKGETLMGSGWPFGRSMLPGGDVARLQLREGRFFFGSPSTVMFRADVVRATTPFYDSRVPHADTEACYRTLRTWDFGFVPQVLSFLRVEPVSRMGSVRDFHPYALDKLIVVRKFGRDFLDEVEYGELEGRTRGRYFRMLAEALVDGAGPEFWRYHREGLATVGLRIDARSLGRPTLAVGIDAVLNPKKTVGRLVRRMRGRQEDAAP